MALFREVKIEVNLERRGFLYGVSHFVSTLHISSAFIAVVRKTRSILKIRSNNVRGNFFSLAGNAESSAPFSTATIAFSL